MFFLGVPHGHTGHVRFLTCVETTGNPKQTDNSIKHNSNNSTARKQHHNIKNKMDSQLGGGGGGGCGGGGGPSKMLVISGGDGYEDFRNSNTSEVAGREDSTNHLLLWQI